jgi:FHS family L-fucose permease-like MFS transporter
MNQPASTVYTLIASGLCCFIMWPFIFSFGLAGPGKYTSLGSAFLILMILGIAIISPFRGAIGDINHGTNMHNSYLAAPACFAVLALLAIRFRSVLKALGLNFDEQVTDGSH